MTLRSMLVAVMVTAGLLFEIAGVAAAQGTPSSVPVPNSSNVLHCNPNGSGSVSSVTNGETEAANPVPGTPVTQVNPNGQGTTSTQTPLLQKPEPPPSSVQCPKTQENAPEPMPPQNMTTQPVPAPPPMNALTNNPNGSNWLDKFNRNVAKAKHGKSQP